MHPTQFPNAPKFITPFISASALECFQCLGTTNKNCTDMANARKIECRGNAEFCSKIVLNGGKNLYKLRVTTYLLMRHATSPLPNSYPILLFPEVTRGCYKQDPDEDHEVGCRTAGATTSCYCDSDGCNGAVETRGGGAWKMLTAIAALLPTAIGARMVL